MRYTTTIIMGAMLGLGWLAATGCTITEADAECKTDEQCRGTRICVDGACQFAVGLDTAPADDRDTQAPPPDTNEPVDTTDPAPPDTRAEDSFPPPPPDTSPYDTQPRPDYGPPRDTTYSELPTRDAAVFDAGPDRELSCHEFATCQAIVCERFDYSCRDDYSSRTPESELELLDERQRCMQNHCRGTQGQERIECTVDHCEVEFDQCTEGTGQGKFSCSEFHGCLHLCNGRDDTQSCHADCQQRASQGAQKKLQAYHECFADNCEGEEGRDAWRCARHNCSDELSGCWGC